MSPVEPKRCIPRARVRLWDSNWELRREMNDALVYLTSTGIAFIIPADSEGARFLIGETEQPHPLILVTIDDEGVERRYGVVRGWEIHRAGDCPKCEHCQTPMLTVRVDEGLPGRMER
ncbi:hypothetical protein [Nocardia sp. FDAARGOS_372]|uniref:hypothetical protein n=1 Tax=Nocardia sp. FDAARGOS_372 TaxID=2018066 RepID=UPI000FD9DA54|nr:hypothetical protein [Nocardia sp. FDAARGOS_372]